jgi:hypothetical protein
MHVLLDLDGQVQLCADVQGHTHGHVRGVANAAVSLEG